MATALTILVGVLFFLSGFTGLVYEVVWAKYLALVLGSTADAQIGVLAVFMGGLACGSWLWGSYADRHTRPLVLYGLLELGIGVYTALFVLTFDALSDGYWSALATVGNTGIAAAAVKVAFCLAAMLLPTLCMGGTLPILAHGLGLERWHLGRGVAYLYAVNCFGAALGAVLAGFVLVARWGFDGSFLMAASVNVLIGLVAMIVGTRVGHNTRPMGGEESTAEVSGATSEATRVRGYGRLVLLAAAVSGAVAMIYEVAWIRLCSLVLGSSTYSFAIMLTAFITGIALGSMIYTLTNPTRERPLRFFAVTSIGAAAVLLACLPFYDRLPFYAARLTWAVRQTGASFAIYQATTLLFCFLVMLPLTCISGLNFPALTQAAAHARRGIGRPISAVLFCNTAGTIAGTIAAGLYLLPLVGLHTTFLLGGAAFTTGLLLLWCNRSVTRWRVYAVGVGGVVALVVWLTWLPNWDLRLLVAGEFRRHEGVEPLTFDAYRTQLDHEVVFCRDGRSATVSVERRPEGEVVLRTNGKADASALGDSDTQLLFGHLPAVLYPTARHALVVGYGSGMTVGALLQHPFETVEVVEIAPEVIAADEYFRPYNHDPLHDPRTQVYVEDARTFLYRAPRQYDIIVSEPSNPWIAGIGNLFTEEFFAQARRRLAPGGLLVQWFHSYETSNALVALVFRTIAHEFGDVHVFQSNRWDLLLVAAASPRPVASAAMQAAFARASDLAPMGITRLSTLLGLEVLPDALVRRLGGDGPRNRDRLPLLEFGAPRAFFNGSNATMVADVRTVPAEGFLQPTAALSGDELSELTAYLRRADLFRFNQTVRVLSEWLARTPNNDELWRAVAEWMALHPNEPLLLPSLVAAAARVEPAMRHDTAHALLRTVRSISIRPDARNVQTIAPVVVDTARQEQRRGLLVELGQLYAAAGAPADAVTTFDAALAQPPSAGTEMASAATLQCDRAQALERCGDAVRARAAFEECLSGAGMDLDTQRIAQAGLQRLNGTAPR